MTTSEPIAKATVDADKQTPRGDHCHVSGSERETVWRIETEAIETRRKLFDRSGAGLCGLALSGGGIRAASISLGVLQALDTENCIEKIDYLSTVSGGGYIGCCLTACMNHTRGSVPFNAAAGNFSDTPAIRQIRNLSNYLIPHGIRDVIVTIGLIARGLVANAIIAAPFLVAAVTLLLYFHPTVQSLSTYGWLRQPLVDYAMAWHVPFIPGFPFTTAMAALLVVVLVLWAFAKSFVTSDLWDGGRPKAPSHNNAKSDAIINDATKDDATKIDASKGDKAETEAAKSDVTKSDATKSDEFSGPYLETWRWASVATFFIALYELQPICLALLAHQQSDRQGCASHLNGSTCIEPVIRNWLNLAPYLSPFAAVIVGLYRQIVHVSLPQPDKRIMTQVKRFGAKALLLAAAIIVPSMLWVLYLRITLALQPADGATFKWLLLCLFIALIGASLINPNATSLHRLYRDRLSKTFLFDPKPIKDPDGELTAITPRLQEIDPKFCPYPIINAALNLEGSRFANQRGRNADFFEFTPEFTGSEATGWVGTKYMEEAEPKLDLGTAMAISGGALSPNMGSATIKVLVPTLALLNVRLGFWLRNPRYAAKPISLFSRLFDIRSFLLVKEIFGRIDETSSTVYVTDGGNLENLGMIALLKRRCKLIIVVDAEADPKMGFGSLIKLERFARIDLGALITLPWESLRDSSLAYEKAVANGDPLPHGGSHVAVGKIRYGSAERGIILYLKSSLTGDEPDYVLDYKRRSPDFPHETTSDQFFGEEQLEVYRALGFHIMKHVLDDRAPLAIPSKPEHPRETCEWYRKEIKTFLLTQMRAGHAATKS